MLLPPFYMPETPPERPADDGPDPRERLPAEPPVRRLELRPQEVPFGDPESRWLFATPGPLSLVVTPAAAAAFGLPTILASLYRLQHLARLHGGLDYLQVFQDPVQNDELWFMVEVRTGLVTALLPSDY